MDLTLDTPPPTPTDSNLNEANTNTTSPNVEEKIKLGKHQGSTLSTIYKPEKTFKATPFLWHYDPTPDLKPPDPPDLVLASSLNREGSSPLITKGTSFNHLIVNSDEENNPPFGFFGWIRGALSVISGACLPLHTCKRKGEEQLHPGSPFMHPELRPPHVIAKAAKVSLTTMNQPPKKLLQDSFDSLYKIPKDSTLTSECPSLETATTFEAASDRESNDEISRAGGTQNGNSRKPLNTNRNSLIYGTFAEEESSNEDLEVTIRSPLMGKLQAELSSCIEKRTQNRKSSTDDNKNVEVIKESTSRDQKNNGPPTSNPSTTNSLDNLDVTEEMPLINLSTSEVSALNCSRSKLKTQVAFNHVARFKAISFYSAEAD